MGESTEAMFVCQCLHVRVCAGIICRRAECSVIFSTSSDCFPALRLWCLTLLFSPPIYFWQRVTLNCSSPARLFNRVTGQEWILPSLAQVSSHRPASCVCFFLSSLLWILFLIPVIRYLFPLFPTAISLSFSSWYSLFSIPSQQSWMSWFSSFCLLLFSLTISFNLFSLPSPTH